MYNHSLLQAKKKTGQIDAPVTTVNLIINSFA